VLTAESRGKRHRPNKRFVQTRWTRARLEKLGLFLALFDPPNPDYRPKQTHQILAVNLTPEHAKNPGFIGFSAKACVESGALKWRL
jgi:hypothetical protein